MTKETILFGALRLSSVTKGTVLFGALRLISK